MRKTKKGFTIVELVIVIAVIGILTAILVPTFTNLIGRANMTSDKALLQSLNQSLVADQGEYETMNDVVIAMDNGYGLGITKLKTKFGTNELLYDMTNNKFVLEQKDGDQITYIDDKGEVSYTDAQKLNLWRIASDVDANSPYSTYLYKYNGNGTIANLTKGLDVGSETGVNSITYVGGTTAQTVIIRTNGGTLTIDAVNDTVHHYGSADIVDVINVAETSYHEHETASFIKVANGRVVVNKVAEVGGVHVAANNAIVAFENNTELPILTYEATVTEFKVQTTNQAGVKETESDVVIAGETVTVSEGANAVSAQIAEQIEQAEPKAAATAQTAATTALNEKTNYAYFSTTKEYYEDEASLWAAVREYFLTKTTTTATIKVTQKDAQITIPALLNKSAKDVTVTLSSNGGTTVLNNGLLKISGEFDGTITNNNKFTGSGTLTGTLINEGTYAVGTLNLKGKIINNNGVMNMSGAIIYETATFEGTGSYEMLNSIYTTQAKNVVALASLVDNSYGFYCYAEDRYGVWEEENSKGFIMFDGYYHKGSQLSGYMSSSTSEKPIILETDVQLTANLSASNTSYINLNGHNLYLNGKTIIVGTRSTLHILGEGQVVSNTANNGAVIQVQGTTDQYITETKPAYEALYIGEDVEIVNEVGYGVAVVVYKSTTDKNNPLLNHISAGITLNIAGKITAASGIATSGNITATDIAGTTYATAYPPVINILPTAEITTTSTGIYAAGYAIYNIQGTVTGSTAIELRAGKLTIAEGAVVTGTAQELTCVANGNGSTTEGAGLAVIQHTTKLPIVVTINGGTISGVVGLYENNPQNNTDADLAKVSITVNGGTISSINLVDQDKINYTVND